MDFTSTRFLKLSTLTAFEGALQIEGFVADLVAAPFTPALGTVDGDLTLATFVGYTPSIGDPTPFTLFRDPDANVFVLKPNISGSGNEVKVAGAVTGPETEYGYCIHGGTTTNLLSTALLPSPITVQESGDGVLFPPQFLSFADTWMV